MKTAVAVAIALSLCGALPFATVALPVAEDESVATATEPPVTTTEYVVQTTTTEPIIDTTTKIVVQTNTEPITDTTTGFVVETTTEPQVFTTDNVAETTPEPSELTTSGTEACDTTTIVAETLSANNTGPAEVVKDKVEKVNIDLKKMRVYVLLKTKRMFVSGNYTMRSLPNQPEAGPFNVGLIDVEAAAEAALEPDADGNLQVAETDMHMELKSYELFFESHIGSMGSVLFKGIKPFIINEVNTNLWADINAKSMVF